MKRKILSVLSVLMAVLMSTVALSACNKTPAGADSSGGSGESVSTEQGGELYEFAASDEAAAKVRSMAGLMSTAMSPLSTDKIFLFIFEHAPFKISGYL